MEEFLESSYASRVSTANGRRSLSTYPTNKQENDGRFLKPRKPLEINLTGKFVKRINSGRPITSTKVEVTPRRQPTQRIKLPVPQKPLTTCNYKLPTSLPSKVGDKTTPRTPRSARSKSEMSPLPPHVRATERSPNDSPDSNSFPHTSTRLTFFSGINMTPVKRSTPPTSTNPYDKINVDRRKQLQQLVEMLGETTLTPYLRKLAVGQSNIRRTIVNSDSIDYSVVFGTRL